MTRLPGWDRLSCSRARAPRRGATAGRLLHRREMDLDRLRSFFPATFPFVEEAARVGVTEIRIERLPSGFEASYSLGWNRITLNPDADWENMAAIFNNRHPGLGLTAGDAVVFAFLHECGHATRRDSAAKRPLRTTRHLEDRTFSLEDLARQPRFWVAIIQAGAEEWIVDEYAMERFQQWKRGQR